jgi:hypothetical protein
MRRLLMIGTAVVAAAGVTAAAAAIRAQTAAAPVNTSPPTISGQPYVGKTLTAATGGWQNGPTSYTFQWARCDVKGNGCVQIGGATAKTYVATSADVNHTLEVLVTASNAAGTSTPVSSKPTAVITPASRPKNTTAPSVVGKPLVGEALFANPGKYSGGSVASFAYQWQRCAAAKLTCTDISGASGQEYGVVKADVGERLRVQVTARNPFGSVTTPSPPTHPVTAPVVTVTTTITSSARTTICCRIVRLSGTVSPTKSGETITILAREFDDIASYPVDGTITDASGNWSVQVTPMIQTTYIAQTSTSKSNPVVVSVHPRVGFRVTGKTVSASVTARDSFAGRVAYLQMRTRRGWRRIALAVINQNSVARFHLRLRRGHTDTLRIYLAAAQAGPGYLAGTSPTRHVHGTS